MNEEQLEVLNVTLEVLRVLTLALGAIDPKAMPKVGAVLRAAAVTDEHTSPRAAQMLGELATGVELMTGGGRQRDH